MGVPLPEGSGPADLDPRDKFEGPAPTTLQTQARALGELEKDFAFFTPALFHTHGGLDRDPVQEFVNAADGEPVVSLLKFDRPIFRGMTHRNGDQSWNYLLLAVERGYWSQCLNFLTSVGVLDRRRGLFYRAYPHAVLLADPLLLRSSATLPDPLPLVPVTIFGLTGNREKVLVRSARRPPHDLPRVQILPPDPEVKAQARETFRDKFGSDKKA